MVTKTATLNLCEGGGDLGEYCYCKGLKESNLKSNIEIEEKSQDTRMDRIRMMSKVICRKFNQGDFTPVCTTEMGAMAAYASKFEERGVKLLGLSCDDVQSHKEWIKDIEAYNDGKKVTFPIAADPKREAIKQLNMVDPDEKDSSGALPSRALHLVGPDKIIKLSFLYPGGVGRNMEEVLRVVDAVQKGAKHKICTPANWKQGDPVVIAPSVSNDQAKEMFPQGFETADLPSKKGYLRFTTV